MVWHGVRLPRRRANTGRRPTIDSAPLGPSERSIGRPDQPLVAQEARDIGPKDRRARDRGTGRRCRSAAGSAGRHLYNSGDIV